MDFFFGMCMSNCFCRGTRVCVSVYGGQGSTLGPIPWALSTLLFEIPETHQVC